MFYNFNAHRAKKTKAHIRHSQALAKQIFEKLTAFQRRWADFMQSQAAKFSHCRLKALSLTIMISCAAYCLYLISDGVLALSQAKVPEVIRLLWPFDPTGAKQKARSAFGFKKYLDSLENELIKDSLNQIKQNR